MPARPRKQLVTSRAQYANLLTKLEGGKSNVKVGDMRETLRLVVGLEATLIVAGHKSALLILRKEAVEKAKQLLKRRKKNVRSNRTKRS